MPSARPAHDERDWVVDGSDDHRIFTVLGNRSSIEEYLVAAGRLRIAELVVECRHLPRPRDRTTDHFRCPAFHHLCQNSTVPVRKAT